MRPGSSSHSGHHGDVDLGGTRAAIMYKWPGAIHEGGGTMQLIIDESASPAQRDALQKILTGEDTAEMATFWWVFSAMCPTKLETLFGTDERLHRRRETDRPRLRPRRV